MHIFAVRLESGRAQPAIYTRRRRFSLVLDHQNGASKPGLRKPWLPKRHGLRLLRTGRSVTVTNYGIPQQPVTIAGVPLVPGRQYSWLEHQDLQIGDLLLVRWEADPPSKPLLRWLQVARFLALAALSIAMCWLLFAWAQPPLARQASAPQPTPLPTASATPYPLPTPQPPPTPAQQPVAAVKAEDSVPAATAAALLQAEATQAAVATAQAPTPPQCLSVPFTTAGWDTRMTWKVEPVCIKTGDSYWQLVQARVLTGPEYANYNHVFVDAFDTTGRRDQRASFSMRWPGSECRRPIGPGKPTPIDHGDECVMFGQDSLYSVQMEGLPSEVVSGLGLNVLEGWEAGVAGTPSFYLVFRLRQFQGQ